MQTDGSNSQPTSNVVAVAGAETSRHVAFSATSTRQPTAAATTTTTHGAPSSAAAFRRLGAVADSGAPQTRRRSLTTVGPPTAHEMQTAIDTPAWSLLSRRPSARTLTGPTPVASAATARPSSLQGSTYDSPEAGERSPDLQPAGLATPPTPMQLPAAPSVSPLTTQRRGPSVAASDEQGDANGAAPSPVGSITASSPPIQPQRRLIAASVESAASPTPVSPEAPVPARRGTSLADTSPAPQQQPNAKAAATAASATSQRHAGAPLSSTVGSAPTPVAAALTSILSQQQQQQQQQQGGTVGGGLGLTVPSMAVYAQKFHQSQAAAEGQTPPVAGPSIRHQGTSSSVFDPYTPLGGSSHPPSGAGIDFEADGIARKRRLATAPMPVEVSRFLEMQQVLPGHAAATAEVFQSVIRALSHVAHEHQALREQVHAFESHSRGVNHRTLQELQELQMATEHNYVTKDEWTTRRLEDGRRLESVNRMASELTAQLHAKTGPIVPRLEYVEDAAQKIRAELDRVVALTNHDRDNAKKLDDRIRASSDELAKRLDATTKAGYATLTAEIAAAAAEAKRVEAAIRADFVQELGVHRTVLAQDVESLRQEQRAALGELERAIEQRIVAVVRDGDDRHDRQRQAWDAARQREAEQMQAVLTTIAELGSKIDAGNATFETKEQAAAAAVDVQKLQATVTALGSSVELLQHQVAAQNDIIHRQSEMLKELQGRPALHHQQPTRSSQQRHNSSGRSASAGHQHRAPLLVAMDSVGRSRSTESPHSTPERVSPTDRGSLEQQQQIAADLVSLRGRVAAEMKLLRDQLTELQGQHTALHSSASLRLAQLETEFDNSRDTLKLLQSDNMLVQSAMSEQLGDMGAVAEAQKIFESWAREEIDALHDGLRQSNAQLAAQAESSETRLTAAVGDLSAQINAINASLQQSLDAFKAEQQRLRVSEQQVTREQLEGVRRSADKSLSVQESQMKTQLDAIWKRLAELRTQQQEAASTIEAAAVRQVDAVASTSFAFPPPIAAAEKADAATSPATEEHVSVQSAPPSPALVGASAKKGVKSAEAAERSIAQLKREHEKQLTEFAQRFDAEMASMQRKAQVQRDRAVAAATAAAVAAVTRDPLTPLRRDAVGSGSARRSDGRRMSQSPFGRHSGAQTPHAPMTFSMSPRTATPQRPPGGAALATPPREAAFASRVDFIAPATHSLRVSPPGRDFYMSPDHVHGEDQPLSPVIQDTSPVATSLSHQPVQFSSPHVQRSGLVSPSRVPPAAIADAAWQLYEQQQPQLPRVEQQQLTRVARVTNAGGLVAPALQGTDAQRARDCVATSPHYESPVPPPRGSANATAPANGAHASPTLHDRLISLSPFSMATATPNGDDGDDDVPRNSARRSHVVQDRMAMRDDRVPVPGPSAEPSAASPRRDGDTATSAQTLGDSSTTSESGQSESVSSHNQPGASVVDPSLRDAPLAASHHGGSSAGGGSSPDRSPNTPPLEDAANSTAAPSPTDEHSEAAAIVESSTQHTEPPAAVPRPNQRMPRLGVDVANFDGALTAPKETSLAFRGVVVLAASQGMPAWEAGIRAGDVIVAVNGVSVGNKAALVERLRVAADAVDVLSNELTLDVEYRRVGVSTDTHGGPAPDSVPPLALLRGAGPQGMVVVGTLTARVSALLV